jgi:glycosyltransferase involved in cell wall biosynthesis
MATLLAINNYYYQRGGAEAIFLAHNRMFEALGWKVAPFAMKHPMNLATPFSEYFVEQIEFGTQYSLGEKLRRIPKVIYSLEARRNLARLLDRVRPDVCHAHNIYHHISPSILGLLQRRAIPTVMTLHDLKIACPQYQMLAPDGICERCRGGRLHNVVVHRCIKASASLSAVVMAEALLHQLLGSYRQCVGLFITPSRFYMDKFIEWGMPASKFRHIPNFVDAGRFRPLYAPGKAFVYFGRVSREKGVATLIRCAAAARCKLFVLGTGPELEEMRRLAEQLAADVSFPGHLEGDALHELIRSARAVVLPSEWYENAPVSVLEAYALGKPVIGARIGGIPELIREDETGLTFTSGNESSLTAALHGMAQRSDAQIHEMGRRARSWVEERFTAEQYRERILETYQELGVRGPGVLPATAGA